MSELSGQSERGGAPLLQTYAGRLDAIYEIVREAGIDGVTVREVVERVPWTTDSAEIRAKLMSLRSRGGVFYDADGRRWFR